MFDVNSMFHNDKTKALLVEKYHPKLLTIENSMKLYRDNIENAPVGYIHIKLAVEVFEFICFRHDYMIVKIEKSLAFD